MLAMRPTEPMMTETRVIHHERLWQVGQVQSATAVAGDLTEDASLSRCLWIGSQQKNGTKRVDEIKIRYILYELRARVC